MTKQDVIKPEPKQFLRSEQRHTGLLGRAVAFALIAFDAGRHEILRGVFAALSPRQNMIQCEIFCVTVFAAVLASITVTDVDACALHRILIVLAAQMDIVAQANDRRHGKGRRRRMQNIVAVILLNKHSSAEPQADGSRNADRSKRFIRKIQ